MPDAVQTLGLTFMSMVDGKQVCQQIIIINKNKLYETENFKQKANGRRK
jgi:hypothetical protein